MATTALVKLVKAATSLVRRQAVDAVSSGVRATFIGRAGPRIASAGAGLAGRVGRLSLAKKIALGGLGVVATAGANALYEHYWDDSVSPEELKEVLKGYGVADRTPLRDLPEDAKLALSGALGGASLGAAVRERDQLSVAAADSIVTLMTMLRTDIAGVLTFVSSLATLSVLDADLILLAIGHRFGAPAAAAPAVQRAVAAIEGAKVIAQVPALLELDDEEATLLVDPEAGVSDGDASPPTRPQGTEPGAGGVQP